MAFGVQITVERAANVFDIPGLSFGDRVLTLKHRSRKKVIPSFKPYKSTRPWHLEQFDGSDWDVVVFAEADKNTADPAVAVSKTPGGDGTGMIAAMWQKNAPIWADKPISAGLALLNSFNNWLADEGSFDVQAKNKLATTWGTLKQTR